ncbi:MAG: Crp/Fnr family transcriptional regulator [Flavobacterium sp.]|uniref:Crp/Fnr family transcriptional regulator n=1 Tax=Flavobacterium sp. TaxID=239 RepID=UPI0011FBA475|nr:Crp/Fnr family transcriptional regulator [Flavobacterium sp.]RZJ66228.1 MAG: Crp/Fnr family transcriptional regulator [Flavobacterium sp.]
MQNLLAHIDKFVSLDDREKNLLTSGLYEINIRKKQHLMREGELSHKQFFVSKGCLRLYIINEKGVEQTHQFAIENWWMADYLSYHNESPTTFYIQACEDSTVIAFDKKQMEELLAKIPKLERYFRLCYQKSVGASQKRIRYLFSMSAEERFNNMNSMFPDFIQRVPQYMIASYLDFSPEFMSKIRAGKV